MEYQYTTLLSIIHEAPQILYSQLNMLFPNRVALAVLSQLTRSVRTTHQAVDMVLGRRLPSGHLFSIDHYFRLKQHAMGGR